MTESTGFDPNAVFVDRVVLIRPTPGEGGALRSFSADIETLTDDADEPVQVGSVEGFVGLAVSAGQLLEDADAIDGEALALAEQAVKGLRALGGVADAVVLISEVDLVDGYDDPGVFEKAVEGLLDLLQLDPDGIVVVIDN